MTSKSEGPSLGLGSDLVEVRLSFWFSVPGRTPDEFDLGVLDEELRPLDDFVDLVMSPSLGRSRPLSLSGTLAGILAEDVTVFGLTGPSKRQLRPSSVWAAPELTLVEVDLAVVDPFDTVGFLVREAVELSLTRPSKGRPRPSSVWAAPEPTLVEVDVDIDPVDVDPVDVDPVDVDPVDVDLLVEETVVVDLSRPSSGQIRPSSVWAAPEPTMVEDIDLVDLVDPVDLLVEDDLDLLSFWATPDKTSAEAVACLKAAMAWEVACGLGGSQITTVPSLASFFSSTTTRTS